MFKPNDPLAAWVTLLAGNAALTAVIPAARIVYALDDIAVGTTQHWIVVSPGTMELRNGFWDGYVQLTFMGPQGHINQRAMMTVIEQFCDPLLNFRTHRIAGGSQAGAILSAGAVYGMSRGQIPVRGDFELPYRSINIETKVSAEAMSWS